ncbi:tetraacyldisaccharide 4'-kinase [Pseudoalteromonas peptidolytica]|uniref:tetraacyldisaccharide 4'-kinase n=1 Tax=Pseudoalteromonas peptidolytica TaxID=61150 RepID=UPI00298E9FA3|nr:tetraacyldisaccharide 4'-kinase [Pseudoalteromonas peptidolytica]MDW7548352.1 tetraacyldisaccharide 4'-kinase [Pseudoalteromonas peptidolytica]
MASRIEQSWYKKPGLLTLLLLPLALLFGLISVVRKKLYTLGVTKQYKASVPVIIVGNISVGGNGKTPFVLWLVPFLERLGLKVGIISRGYGANPPTTPFLVTKDTPTEQGGDEPCLLAQRLACPVMIGADRQKSIESLLQHHNIDIIVSDDGLQHYKLARDIEFCIVDAERKFGNGYWIPAGPLRELPSRTKTVDLTVYNGGSEAFSYALEGTGFFHVTDNSLANEVHTEGVSVCAIGNPKRFEHTLREKGIDLTHCLHFADHHPYQPSDFSPFSGDAIFMTEKDAVKCRTFAKDNWYYLRVDAKPTQALEKAILELLKDKGIHHGL